MATPPSSKPRKRAKDLNKTDRTSDAKHNVYNKDTVSNNALRVIIEIPGFAQPLSRVIDLAGNHREEEEEDEADLGKVGLPSSPVFIGLSTPAATQIRRAGKTRTYEAGATLIEQGERTNSVIVIVSGRVSVERKTNDKVTAYSCLGSSSGDVLGLVALNDTPSPISIRAADAVSAMVFRLEDWRLHMRQHPVFAANVAEYLAEALTLLTCHLSELRSRDVPARIAGTLIEIAERDGVKRGDGTFEIVGLTHEALSNMVASARETVTQSLRTLRQENPKAIKQEGRALIVQPDYLKKLLEDR